jgi:hypothetical protein
MIMKRIFFIAMFLVSALAAIGQTDATPDKGTGIWYFSGKPGAVPNETYGSEIAFNLNSGELYKWNRDSSGWFRLFEITNDYGAPSGNPSTGPKTYLNRENGMFYFWDGDSWEGMNDRTRLVQDSILVYYLNLTEIGRDTISGTGGGGGGTDDQTAAEVEYTENGQSNVKGALDSLFSSTEDIRAKSTLYAQSISEIENADTSKIVYWTDSLREGLFIYDSNANYNLSEAGSGIGGRAINSNLGQGQWVRYVDNIYRPEWFGAKGDGITDDSKAFNNMLFDIDQTDGPATIVLRKDSTYIFGNEVGFAQYCNLQIRGNGATIKRADGVISTLASSASNGDTTIVVSDGSVFAVNDRVIIYKTPGDTSNTANMSAKLVITYISGDTLTLNAPISDYTIITPSGNYASGAEVVKVYTLLAFSQDKGDYAVEIYDLTVDGNKQNFEVPNFWSLTYSVNSATFLKMERCSLINAPNETIGANHCEILNCYFGNSEGSAIHYGYAAATFRQNRVSVFSRNECVNMCLVDNGHNEGVVTWSSDVGNVIISDNYVDNSQTGFIGDFGDDDPGDVYIERNRVYNCNWIQQNLSSNIEAKRKIVYQDNEFQNCGELTVTGGTFADSTTIHLIGNQFKYCSKIKVSDVKVVIKNNEFRLDTSLWLLLTESVTLTDNLFYNTQLEAGNQEGPVIIENNRFLNEASSVPNPSNSSLAFLAVQVLAGSPNAEIRIKNNLVHDNNTNNDVYIGISLWSTGPATIAEVEDNTIINCEMPIQSNMSLSADTLLSATYIRNKMYVRTRTRNQSGINNYNTYIQINANERWYNNYFLFDQYAKRMLDIQRYTGGSAIEFIDNQIWSINNGGVVNNANPRSFSALGIIRGNTYNGSEVWCEHYINITSPEEYTICTDNLHLPIEPRVSFPRDFQEKE